MTKKIFLLSTIITLCCFNSLPCTASVINKTVYTDIVASINDYSIGSFNINGYTAVIAEDLCNYGFDVNWVQNERALYITRGSENTVRSTYIAPTVSKSLIGKKAYDVLSTDIKTYINDNLVTSYNIGGQTIIYFDDLAVFGEVNYNNDLRTLKLDISDGLEYKLGNPINNDLYFTKNSANGLSFQISAVNNTNKTIKYFTPRFHMLNSVFDYAPDMYGNYYFDIRMHGPIEPGVAFNIKKEENKVDTYNDNLCHYICVMDIIVEYMDGTSEIISYLDIGTEKTEEADHSMNGYGI